MHTAHLQDMEVSPVRGGLVDRFTGIDILEIGEGCRCSPDILSFAAHMVEVLDYLREASKVDKIALVLLDSMDNESGRLTEQMGRVASQPGKSLPT